MRILAVTSSYPKFPGDVTAPFIESITRTLAQRGHAVDVVLPEHPELRWPHSPVALHPYRYAPHPGWALWGYAASLEADVRVRRRVYLLAPLVALALRDAVSTHLAARRYDVVHAHWVVPNAALVADIVRAHGVPLVVSLHGSDVFLAARLRPVGALARRAFARAGAVTACSDDLRARALALGAAPELTHTVPYGVDLGDFAPHGDVAAVRAELGVPEGAVFVLAVGRLVEKKGFRHLVESAAGAEGLHVVIAGAGDLRAELEALARTLRAPVSFAGVLERPAVARAFGAADVVVVPSVVDRAGNVDGLPNTLLEALAAGRAVIASRVAGIPDVVTDDESGILVTPGDAAALRAALERLVREPATRARLSQAARRLAAARLGWDAAASAFEEAYAQAAALDAR
jgi:glycosyltransferase involved in cell wall biosynthesis